MPSKESVDFLNRFKAYSPEVQKRANLSKIRETYPDINVDEFAKRFGIANVASQPTMQAITEEESKINRVSEPEHERLRRPRIEFPENIPRGIKGMAEGAIKLPWMLGKMGLDPTGEFTEAVAKGAYKHFRGYVPVGGVTGGDVLHKMASDPVATAGDLALGGSAVSQILKAFSKVGRTGRVAETAKMAETVGETIKPIVPPTSPRAELPLAPKRIIEPEPRSSWGMKEELPKTQPSDISGQLKPLAPPVGEPKPPLAPPKLGEKESFIDLAYRKIVSEEKNISEGLDRGFRETDLPILKKFNTGEWFDIDELQKSMGKSYANSEMKTSLSRNISKYKDRGLLDVAWDFDGNSYYAAKGTAKPTNLLDSDAVAVANRAIEVGLDLPSAKDVYVRIKKIDKGDDAIAISEALSYVADAQKQGIPLSKHLKNLSGLSDNESGLGSRIRTLYPDLAAKYKPASAAVAKEGVVSLRESLYRLSPENRQKAKPIVRDLENNGMSVEWSRQELNENIKKKTELYQGRLNDANEFLKKENSGIDTKYRKERQIEEGRKGKLISPDDYFAEYVIPNAKTELGLLDKANKNLAKLDKLLPQSSEELEGFYNKTIKPSPVAEAKPPLAPPTKAKEAWEMTRKEFDNYWVKKTTDELRKEIPPIIEKIEEEIQLLKNDIIREPDNPANYSREKRISELSNDIHKQYSRLGESTLPPSHWMTDSQYRWHQGIDKAISEGRPVPPEVLADYPDLAAKYKPTPISEPKLPLAPPTKAKEAWEAGRVLVPTSEELSQVGAQMSKANLYIKFIGEPFYNKVMDVGRKYIPKPLQRFFLDEYGIPKEFAGMREERLTSARMKTQEAVDWAGERGAMATPEESEAILKAVTDPERTGIAKLKDPKLVEQSQFIADKMSALGDEATELGLIREKSQLFHEGRYLPKIDKMTFADKLKFAKYKMSGRLKQRGEIRTITKDKLAEYESKGWEWFDDITSEGERVGYKVRKFVPFGDVQDPYVLMAKGVADLEHDIAIAKIIKDVATNPEWASAEPIKNFVKLGDYKIDSRMGKISNIRDMYVQPDIARELAEMIRYQRPINQFMSSMLSLWKIGKTAYNPPTHARNLISNAILSDVVGGLSPFRRFDIYASSLRDLATQKGQYFKEFRDAGGMGNTFVNQEINQIFRASEGAKNPIQLFRRITESKFLGAPSRLYQAEEQWFKLANFTFQRQRGLSIAESIAEANKAVFDYSKVSPFVRKARRTIAPFITFPAKAAPRLFEATIKHPLRVGKYILAFKYLTDYSKHKLGLSDEQYAEIKRNLPEEMRSNQWVLMPEKDKNNNLLFFNATYVSPWGELVSGGSMIPLPGGSVAEQIIAPTNPLFRVSAELITNKSIFTKQPIWKTGENWIKKGAMHAAEAALPPTTPLIGRTAEGIRQNLIMQKQNRYGETKSRLRAVGDIVGLRTTSVNMGRQKIFNALNLKKKTDDIRSRITSIGLDKSLSAEEKNNRIKGLIKLQQEYIEEYRGQQ